VSVDLICGLQMFNMKDVYLGLKIIGVALVAVKAIHEFKESKMEFNQDGLKDLVKLASELTGKQI